MQGTRDRDVEEGASELAGEEALVGVEHDHLVELEALRHLDGRHRHAFLEGLRALGQQVDVTSRESSSA